jgi:hypothetical protein
MTTRTINQKEARELLQREWFQVWRDERELYLDDPLLCTRIKAIIDDGPAAYRYLLLTNSLAKVVNPKVSYRAVFVRADSQLDYSPQRLARNVVSPWEEAIGDRLGGQDEPLNHLAVRTDQGLIEDSLEVGSEEQRLAQVLEQLEVEVNASRFSPLHVLRQVIQALTTLPVNQENSNRQLQTTLV